MRSDSIDKLALALSRAQGQFRNVPQCGKNHWGKYATLADIFDTVRGPLADNELSVSQMPLDRREGVCTLTTLLLHSSGQWIGCEFSLPYDSEGSVAHKWASVLTYARRYGLLCILGIIGEDDDDDGGARDTLSSPVRNVPIPTSFNREVILARIAELGGNMESARAMGDTTLVAYERSLLKNQEAMKLRENSKEESPEVIEGYLIGEPYVSEKICKFDIGVANTERVIKCAVFPRNYTWTDVVGTDGTFLLPKGVLLQLRGHTKTSERYGPTFIVSSVSLRRS